MKNYLIGVFISFMMVLLLPIVSAAEQEKSVVDEVYHSVDQEQKSVVSTVYDTNQEGIVLLEELPKTEADIYTYYPFERGINNLTIRNDGKAEVQFLKASGVPNTVTLTLLIDNTELAVIKGSKVIQSHIIEIHDSQTIDLKLTGYGRLDQINFKIEII